MTDLEYLKKYYTGNIEEAIRRLEQGEPIQYIVGNVDFYHSNIKVTIDVLIPRFETEGLVDNLIKLIKNETNYHPLKILEIGTGSGCIAITLSKELDTTVDALDISIDAINVAKQNAKENNIDINFIHKDMSTYTEKRYDVIISNPPYIRYDEDIMDIVKDNEPHLALFAGDDGLDCYRNILNNVKEHLKEKYLITFEIGYTQANDIKTLTQQVLPEATIEVKKDLSEKDRMIFIHN